MTRRDAMEATEHWDLVPASEDAEASERRRMSRIPLGFPVRLRIDGSPIGQTVSLRDLSRTGAFVELDEESDAPVGARVALGFAVPNGPAALARGRIVRKTPNGIAVALDELTGAFAALVEVP